MKEDGLGML